MSYPLLFSSNTSLTALVLSQVIPGHLKYAEGSAVEVGKLLANEGGRADMAVTVLVWRDWRIV